MSVVDKTSLVRQLVPKSYHFDGYNEINCQNSRDKPFFEENNIIPMGRYYLCVRKKDPNTIILDFKSVCEKGQIYFENCEVSLTEYVSKLKKAIQDGADFITFEITPRYDLVRSADYCKICSERNEDCIHLRKTLPNKILAAVSFDTKKVKKALAMYFEITKKTTSERNDSIMRNNKKFFGMNFELGLSKDHNIAATLMGVAVRNTESGDWYTFDVANNTRKNLANMKMGDFPIFLLPTKKLEVGDLIKKDGKYYYVKSVNPNNTTTLIGAADGVIREMLKEESIIPGMTIYTKVVAFDTKSLMDTGSKENMGGNVLAAMCMMNWANGNKDEFSLDNINDDSFNGLGSCLPMLMAMNGSEMGGIFSNVEGGINIPMIMALGASGNSDADNMTQMLLLTQLLSGEAKNPIAEIISQPVVATVTEPAGKVICDKCHTVYPEGTNYCSKCGSATKSVAIKCRKCGETLKEGAFFCHNCGTKATQDTCPKCGIDVEDGANFCSGCGASLIEVVEEPAKEEAPAESK